MTTESMPIHTRWKIKELAILIAMLAVGFAFFRISGTVLISLMLTPVMLAPPGRKFDGLYWVAALYPFYFLIGAILSRFEDEYLLIAHDEPAIMLFLLFLMSPFVMVAAFCLSITRMIETSPIGKRWIVRSYPFFVALVSWILGSGLIAALFSW